ncbi:MAG TPA: type IV pilus assembly protein PilM [Actinomycetota bacterium]|nr:type IV pilus assembly protein PilM [Actinomycetota bacterium]
MGKTRIGLDIGSTAVRAAEVAGGPEAATVVRAAQVQVPVGAVENGEVRQPDAVAEALRELWSRGGFKEKKVFLGVGNQRVVVREVTLPWLPEKELRESLGYQVQEFIPISVEDAVLDFDPLGEFEQEGRRMLRIMLVAAQKLMVNMVVQAAEQAKLDPVGIDLVPFALVRSVGTSEGGMNLDQVGDEAMIDVGAHVTNICVHDGGITRFVRILPSGGRDVTLAIARGLGVDDEVAERLKRGEAVEGAPPVEEVRRIAMQRAAAFIDEVRSSLEFYTAQVPGARIGRVVVTGGGSKLAGFLELMQERIPVTVERGRAFSRATSKLPLDDEAVAEAEPVLAVAVGLATPAKRAAA